ncbi:hypothetical protein ACJX0J_030232, partial [Zea mays]
YATICFLEIDNMDRILSGRKRKGSMEDLKLVLFILKLKLLEKSSSILFYLSKKNELLSKSAVLYFSCFNNGRAWASRILKQILTFISLVRFHYKKYHPFQICFRHVHV